ncbi:MAG TPA: DNA primase [bacterium]|nr:DNA primase [bacterium]
MAFSIPDEIVDKVREAADIVDVISDHVTLRQTGRSFKAICPFHSEKTPSFVVSREKQIYHCFGCGAGGNVINFVMKFENITFPEALRALAKRYGIPIPKSTVSGSSEAEFGYRLNALAARVYRSALSGTKEGTQARTYLRGRGIGEETEKAFALGYAPSEGNLVLQEARRQKIDPARLVALGLAVARDREVRELFRRRIMFPIITAGSRVLAFGGRVMDASEPKYLNSPETYLFKKSSTLYGIHAAKGDIRSAGSVIVVEGYMDAITMHVGGFPNTVASLGTAFTADQARALRRYCENVILLYDGDEAGRNATLRSLSVAAEADLKLKVTRLPDGEDPDSFLRRHGPEALAELLGGAAHYIDFILAQSGEEEGEAAVKFALKVIGRIKDPIRVSFDLRRLSATSGIAEAVLAKSLATLGSSRDVAAATPEDNRGAPCDKLEKSLISILIGFPEYTDRVFGEISPADFSDHRMRNIAEVIASRKSRGLGIDTSALLSVIEDEDTRALLIDCSVSGSVPGDTEKAFSDHILCMKKRVLANEIDDLRRRIRVAEKDGDGDLLGTLLTRRHELAQQLRLLST